GPQGRGRRRRARRRQPHLLDVVLGAVQVVRRHPGGGHARRHAGAARGDRRHPAPLDGARHRAAAAVLPPQGAHGTDRGLRGGGGLGQPGPGRPHRARGPRARRPGDGAAQPPPQRPVRQRRPRVRQLRGDAGPMTTAHDVRDRAALRRDAWRAYFETTALLTAEIERHLKADSGLDIGDFNILLVLSEAPGERLRLRDLARAVAFGPNRLTYRLDALERRGWVRRARGTGPAAPRGRSTPAASTSCCSTTWTTTRRARCWRSSRRCARG